MSDTPLYADAFGLLSKSRRTSLLKRLAENVAGAMACGNNTTLLELAHLGMKVDSKRSWWGYVYAEALRGAGRVGEAEGAFLKVHPHRTSDRHLVEIRLGLLYRDSGQFAKAERWFKAATRTAPGDTAPWIYYGGFLARSERFSKACEILEHGLLAAGDVDEVWLNLGLNKRGLGDYQGARSCFKNAMKISPDYEAARAALADIELAISVKALEARDVSRWSGASALTRGEEKAKRRRGSRKRAKTVISGKGSKKNDGDDELRATNRRHY